MKKNIIALFVCFSLVAFSQAPQSMNYQGVARDAVGNIINTTIGLKFEILQGSPTGSTVYAEINTSLPSSAGIFTASIGSGAATTGTFSAINWAAGPYYITVSIDPAGGTSFTAMGTSQLLSVPYALYAEKAGSSSAMPTGTLTGQTLYWDNPGNKWVVDKNILNNGSQVVVGDPLITGNNKMKVITYSNTDSSAIYAYHPNATANQSAIRGFASGSASNSGTLTFNPIMGGHFIGYNINNGGSAVGAVGQAFSPGGDAIGVIAVGTSSSTLSGRSVGLYASGTGPNIFNNYAAFFDKGKVFINDTLIINTNGSIGDVLTRGVNGKANWAPVGAGALWTKPTASVVTLNNNADYVGIGTNSPFAKLHVSENMPGSAILGSNTNAASLSNAHGVQGTTQSSHSLSAGVYGSHSSNGFGVYAINTSSLSLTGSGVYGLSMGTTTNNVGIRGDALNGNGVGVMGISFGTGAAINGIKPSTAPSGNAGKFEISNVSNNADAVLILTNGLSSAIHTKNTASAGSNNLGLLIEDGHIGSLIAAAPTASVNTSLCTACTAGSGTVMAHSNDIAGTITFSMSASYPANFDFTVNYAKPYRKIPVVTITPANLIGGNVGKIYVVNLGTPGNYTGFQVFFISGISGGAGMPRFNYMVIEGGN